MRRLMIYKLCLGYITIKHYFRAIVIRWGFKAKKFNEAVGLLKIIG